VREHVVGPEVRDLDAHAVAAGDQRVAAGETARALPARPARREPAMRRAITAYDGGLALDPDYAVAWVDLTLAYGRTR
jgi:hypothetical protein